jgi:2-methylcitrate dehydratase
MAISEELAEYTLGFAFENLSGDEVHAAKRTLLDTLACGVGASQGNSSKIVRNFVKEQGGVQESTVIGSRIKVPCANAAFANGAMVRYLDYNDTYWLRGKLRYGIHPDEFIPATLALAERQYSSGKDVISSIILSYDLAGRFIDATYASPLGSRGRHYSTIAGFVVSLFAGRLLGLNKEQLVNGLGIAGVHSATLDIIDAAGETYNMTKNIGLPYVAQGGITAALLAQKGFTGPTRVIEGNKGFVQTIMDGKFDLEILMRKRERPTIFDTDQKSLAAEHTTQGALNAVLKLVKEHNILPEQVREVRIEVPTRTAEHTGDQAKRHPKDKETADHSLYYVVAVAIIDRAVGPSQYSVEKLTSQQVHKLMDKITVEASPELDEFIYAGIAHIWMEDGRRFSCRVDYPKGNSRNPMTDEEIVEKFRGVASVVLDKERVKRITDCVFELDKLKDIHPLMEPLAFG